MLQSRLAMIMDGHEGDPGKRSRALTKLTTEGSTASGLLSKISSLSRSASVTSARVARGAHKARKKQP